MTVNNGDTITAAQIANLVYTPPANQNGAALATFDFTVNDGGAEPSRPDGYRRHRRQRRAGGHHQHGQHQEDTPLTFASGDFTFTDVESDALVCGQITNLNLNGGTLTHCGVTVNNGDTITAAQIANLVYTPADNQNGLAGHVRLHGQRRGAGTVAATMNIDVTPVNDVPVASNNTVSTNEDTPLNFASGDFTFTDVESDALVSAQSPT